MILVLDGIICMLHRPDMETVQAPAAQGGRRTYRRLCAGADKEFLTKVFSAKDTRGDEGSAST